MNLEIIIYSDPGHSWGKVPISLIKEMGIAKEISGCSYQNGGNAYLEEDCDLPCFVQAWKQAGNTVSFAETYTENRASILGPTRYRP